MKNHRIGGTILVLLGLALSLVLGADLLGQLAGVPYPIQFGGGHIIQMVAGCVFLLLGICLFVYGKKG